MGTPISDIPNKKQGLKPSKIIKIGNDGVIRTHDFIGYEKKL